MWHCKECGIVGVYKGIIFNDEEKTIFLCYCEECKKEFTVVLSRNESMTINK